MSIKMFMAFNICNGFAAAMVIYTMQSYREREYTLIHILVQTHITDDMFNMLYWDREVSTINYPQQFELFELKSACVSLWPWTSVSTLQRSVCRNMWKSAVFDFYIPLSKAIFLCQVHQVEPQNGRISFDIDPSATGLVLREAGPRWISKTFFWLLRQNWQLIGDRLVFLYYIYIHT